MAPRPLLSGGVERANGTLPVGLLERDGTVPQLIKRVVLRMPPPAFAPPGSPFYGVPQPFADVCCKGEHFNKRRSVNYNPPH